MDGRGCSERRLKVGGKKSEDEITGRGLDPPRETHKDGSDPLLVISSPDFNLGGQKDLCNVISV